LYQFDTLAAIMNIKVHPRLWKINGFLPPLMKHINVHAGATMVLEDGFRAKFGHFISFHDRTHGGN
jgi:hypothetical protein